LFLLLFKVVKGLRKEEADNEDEDALLTKKRRLPTKETSAR